MPGILITYVTGKTHYKFFKNLQILGMNTLKQPVIQSLIRHFCKDILVFSTQNKVKKVRY